MHDASPESCVDGADIAVGFMLNSVVLCWQSVFEIGTSCKKKYLKRSQLLPFGRKNTLIKESFLFKSFNKYLGEGREGKGHETRR